MDKEHVNFVRRGILKSLGNPRTASDAARIAYELVWKNCSWLDSFLRNDKVDNEAWHAAAIAAVQFTALTGRCDGPLVCEPPPLGFKDFIQLSKSFYRSKEEK